jgi:hypothetical protein
MEWRRLSDHPGHLWAIALRSLQMRVAATAFIAVLAFATSSPAKPVGLAATGGDERCLLAMVALSNSTDPNEQAFGQVGTVYFMGRIAAQDPGFDFAQLRAMAATMDAKSAEADLRQNCGPMFQKSMAQLTDALAGSALPSPR